MIALSADEVRAVLHGLGYKETTGPMADRRVAGIGAVVDALLRADETVHAEIVDETADQLDELHSLMMEAFRLPAGSTHTEIANRLRASITPPAPPPFRRPPDDSERL